MRLVLLFGLLVALAACTQPAAPIPQKPTTDALHQRFLSKKRECLAALLTRENAVEQANCLGFAWEDYGMMSRSIAMDAIFRMTESIRMLASAYADGKISREQLKVRTQAAYRRFKRDEMQIMIEYFAKEREKERQLELRPTTVSICDPDYLGGFTCISR